MESISNELVWFIFGLVLLLAELITPGFIVIFFGIGAWIISLLLWLGVPISFAGQLFIFLITSVVLLLLFRKYGKNYFRGKVTRPDARHAFDDIKGEKAVVISEILPNVVGGKVEFHGTVWNAESEVFIGKGSSVEIVEQNNLTLKVKPI